MNKSNAKKKIVIVGGGIIGLSCALALSSDYQVTIVAEKVGVKSDSWKATAIWHVYLVPETKQVLDWAAYTLKVLCDFAKLEDKSGIELVKGVELFRNSEASYPSWSKIPPLFKMLSEEEISSYNRYDKLDLTTEEASILEKHPIKWGYHIEAPTANMHIYLPWLEQRVVESGIKIIKKKIGSFQELVTDYDLLINCTGFGSRELGNDKNFEVYRGQYFILKAEPNSPKIYVGDDDHPGGMAYMIPRLGEVMVGGCAEKNIESLELTLTWDDTLRRAGLYVPWLRNRKPSDQAREPVVCIRPSRNTGIRLEIDKDSISIPIIHNYGHGGSGFSLSWGCAESVKSIIKEKLS
jgi:D-amino-acid oxidase